MQIRLFWAVSLTMLVTVAIQGAEMEKTRVSEFGFHGPVAQCIERTTYPAGPGTIEQHSTVTTNFGRDGWVLDVTSKGDGGPTYVRTFSHNEAGRLTKTTSGIEGNTPYTANYSYDDHGQLSSVSSGNGPVIPDYQYSDDRKRKTHILPKYELAPNTAVAGTSWEDSDLFFTPPSGGTVTTTYDEKDRPKEGEVRDANGQLILRIVRTYDEKGRTKGDKVVREEVTTPLLPQIEQAPEFSQMNAAQKRTLTNLVTRAFSGGESVFKYDDQGRVIEKLVSRGAFGEEITKTSYNERGDVSEQTVGRTFNSQFAGGFGMDEAGNIVSGPKTDVRPPEETTVRYTYEYDGHGNWTKKTTESRSNPKDEFAITAVAERTLIYY